MAKKKVAKKKTTIKKTTTKKTTAKFSVKKAAIKKVTARKETAAKNQYKFGPGDKVPSFKVPDSTGAMRSLTEFKGKYLVLYFYPKDNTPGCTQEGQDFKRLYSQFQKAGCEILGISKDSVRSHAGFRGKHGFPFELLSDSDEVLCRAFDVIQMKSLYGRKFEGVERSTFVVGRDGKVLKEWRKVKVNGHAEEVLEFVKSQG